MFCTSIYAAGKGLTSWLSFVVFAVICHLPIGILGQVWYLIVSIPDLCTLIYFYNHFDGNERAGCFALFVFLVSRGCSVALPHDATGLSAVCDCGIS